MGNEQSEHYLALIRELIAKSRENLKEAETMLARLGGEQPLSFDELVTDREQGSGTHARGGEVLEGIFNGIEFVSRDVKVYAVPQNYASKSKLVEGDLLKLTIKSDGTFIYKQIGPVERERVRGVLARDPETQLFAAAVGERVYKLLTASVTYHDGEVGDEVVLLVPKGGRAHWAAVENVIKT